MMDSMDLSSACIREDEVVMSWKDLFEADPMKINRVRSRRQPARAKKKNERRIICRTKTMMMHTNIST